MNKYRNVETAIAATITNIERIDGKAAVLSERIGQEQRTKDRLAQEIARLTAEMDENRSAITSKRGELSAKQQQVIESEDALALVLAEFQQAVTLIGQVEQEIEQAKEQTFGHLQELVTQQNRLATLERDLETQKLEATNLATECQDGQSQLAEAEKLWGDNKAEQGELEQQIREVDGKIQDLSEQKEVVSQSLNDTVAEESRLAAKISEAMSRLKVLSNMQEEYEGFGRGPRSVLKSDAPWRKGVGGAVAQILSVPDHYVTAVETALGGALQHTYRRQ